MATLLCFHAHPDDEAIATGGLMAMAADAGHRVVLVCATKGEQGEPQPGVLNAGETLGDRRVEELQAAAEVLGVARLEFLGYRDSGMMGTEENYDQRSFWMADIEEASERLAVILREERPDTMTFYDAHGGYGHPDHIMVHRVGTRAAQLAGITNLYWSTMNRTKIREQMAVMVEAMAESGQEVPSRAVDDDQPFGLPDAWITHAVDVSSVIDRKKESMKLHRSQIGPDTFFLAMPDEAFVMAFGQEWFVAAPDGIKAAPRSGEYLTALI